MDIVEIRTSLIDEDTDQPRYQFDEEALQELMNSIEELGLLSPIKVRNTGDGRYKIIYGNRRYKACKTLGRPTIPCIVSDVTDELEIYLEQIAENLTRQGFSPIEEAEAFHKLLHESKFNSSVKYLSGKLGKPESYIKNKCELLKFGPAVKKLIVGGTEIRKDLLTEDQLLPLKDLPMEYRDPLALIMARDEMPVSDVKKIARLFKDKDISDGIKSKLLYKTGPSLIETWSSYELTKAERAKASEPKPAKKTKGAEPESTTAAAADGEAQSAVPFAAGAQGAAPASDAVAPAGLAIQDKLQRLLAALPAQSSLPVEDLQSLARFPAGEADPFLNGVDALIANLERHLAEWKTVRDRAKSLTV
ncbi:ParB/RepB/Spo0J family partition protein [Cohnella nanjingensis]|uniref:ParB/RepB/Spo0J family partition protein n=1 Tax=Cohnella nanjingensis TaxID=1387779 RepID=A0A7X0VF06_9BACL|nr:ParB/RepB/Spo0J family partition protein [Cohnella nanjingensis]MBB6671560.1 ParB/RepB/Spo0J family partition protein [Cohnella nanjingensis]